MTDNRILLVEDDRDLGFLLAHVLRSEGFVVDLAATAAAAAEHLDRHQYAVVITDWKLPDGDGIAIADAASELGAKTIVMSGHLFQLPGARVGAHDLLMKPARPSEVVDAVERAIGQQSAR